MRSVYMFARILGIAGIIGICGYILIIRPWHIRWGATDAELSARMPGDEIVGAPRMSSTHAITIQAPLQAVWPWINQIGQERGGFYSYTMLENLVGCAITNADTVHPEWQLQLNDRVSLGPQGYPFFIVTAVDPQHALVLTAGQQAPDISSWVFMLKPIDAKSTRLIVRNRGNFRPTIANYVMWQGIVEPISFVMERAMLLGIRTHAERMFISTS